MLELMKIISRIPCVNGSEYELVSALTHYFEEKGLSVTTFPGNHVLVRPVPSDDIPETVIFTPLDSPGYICLYRDENGACLAATSKDGSELKEGDRVYGKRVKEATLYSSVYDEKILCIKDESAQVGDTFLAFTSAPVSASGDGFCCRYCARFSCIAVLMKLAENLKNPKVAVCFTSGFHSASKSEANVMNRIGAKRAILLGYASEKNPENFPILALKDGKNFSSTLLAESFCEIGKNNRINVSRRVFDQPITAAERLFSPYAREILSLALPCKNAFSEEEWVGGAEDMLTVLTQFVNRI